MSLNFLYFAFLLYSLHPVMSICEQRDLIFPFLKFTTSVRGMVPVLDCFLLRSVIGGASRGPPMAQPAGFSPFPQQQMVSHA